MPDLFSGRGTDPTWGIEQDNVLINTHSEDSCRGEWCVLHNPSNHKMRSWPTLWRDDRKMMERTCPHGVGHPDPDDFAYQIRNGRSNSVGVHGCDGCCVEESE